MRGSSARERALHPQITIRYDEQPDAQEGLSQMRKWFLALAISLMAVVSVPHVAEANPCAAYGDACGGGGPYRR